jgi:hypothetical protein
MSLKNIPEQLTLDIEGDLYRFTPMKHWRTATDAGETYGELLKLERVLSKRDDGLSIWQAICAEINT